MFSDVNYCLSNPCNNGGVCDREFGGYQCDCHSFYEGTHCDNGKYVFNIHGSFEWGKQLFFVVVQILAVG